MSEEIETVTIKHKDGRVVCDVMPSKGGQHWLEGAGQNSMRLYSRKQGWSEVGHDPTT